MDTTRHCEICGSAFPPLPRTGGTGYAIMRQLDREATAMRICYACADVNERAHMRATGHTTAYVSNLPYTRDRNGRIVGVPAFQPWAGPYVRTWSGGPLLRITSYTVPQQVGFGERFYFRAVDDHTKDTWYGSGGTRWTEIVHCHRTKSRS